MKIRIKFSKTGELKYIGHLDIMRSFQKAFRRAGFDVAYSQGFNPHQILSFSAPLGLGMISSAEYCDVELNSSDSSDVMIKKLQDVVFDGITIHSFKKIPDEKKYNAMASLKYASYRLHLDKCICDAVNCISKEQRDEYKLTINDNTVSLFLPAGSEKNIKPLPVIESMLNDELKEKLLKGYETGEYYTERLEQYTIVDNEIISLDEVGESI